MITGTFAAVLRANRTDFNARFSMARRRFPGIDKQVFAAFLENRVVPVVEAVEAVQPERVAEAVYAAFDVGLELAGQQLIGCGAQSPAMDAGWRDLLPAVAPLVAQGPDRLLPALSNALYNLAHTTGARPAFWIEEMQRLSPLCTDSSVFLKVGQVVAWRAGMAHLRQGALATAAALSPVLALAAVGGPADADWPDLLSRLRTDPWCDPSTTTSPDRPAATFGEVARVGGFRGFGGPFIAPPLVACDGDHFWVRSADECWLLMADCFGHTFHRATLAEFDAAAGSKASPKDVQIRGTKITCRERIMDLVDLESFSSSAANRHTLALTSPQTHSIVLISLRP
ncbi:MAG: hypothetical protein WAU91_01255 [Desulfatitalea sp.]